MPSRSGGSASPCCTRAAATCWWRRVASAAGARRGRPAATTPPLPACPSQAGAASPTSSRRLAAETRQAGRTFAFHPHAGTFVETPAEIRRLAAATDPTRVAICLDAGHCDGRRRRRRRARRGARAADPPRPRQGRRPGRPRRSAGGSPARLRRGDPGPPVHGARPGRPRRRRPRRRARGDRLWRLADGRAGQLLARPGRVAPDRPGGARRGPSPDEGRPARRAAGSVASTPGCSPRRRASTRSSSPTRSRTGPWRSPPRPASAPPRRSRPRSTRPTPSSSPAATNAHATLIRDSIGAAPADVLREAARRRPRRRRSTVAAAIEASGVPFQLGFQRRFDAGYREARRRLVGRRAGHALRVPPRRPRPAPPHEAVHPGVGRAVPRLLDPRLRRHPLADRPARSPRSTRTAASGASRCSRSTATSTRPSATLRLADGALRAITVARARPARLRHPGGAVRLEGLDQRRPGAADADPLGRAGRARRRPVRRGPTSSIGSAAAYAAGARDLRPGRPR